MGDEGRVSGRSRVREGPGGVRGRSIVRVK